MKHLTIALIMTLVTSFSALAGGKSSCPLANNSLTSNAGALTKLSKETNGGGQVTAASASSLQQR